MPSSVPPFAPFPGYLHARYVGSHIYHPHTVGLPSFSLVAFWQSDTQTHRDHIRAPLSFLFDLVPSYPLGLLPSAPPLWPLRSCISPARLSPSPAVRPSSHSPRRVFGHTHTHDTQVFLLYTPPVLFSFAPPFCCLSSCPPRLPLLSSLAFPTHALLVAPPTFPSLVLLPRPRPPARLALRPRVPFLPHGQGKCWLLPRHCA